MWLPHTTVAAVVENDGKFLLVHEISNGKSVYNQPAGHLEKNETLIEACIREAYEETGWKVKPTGFLGISQYTSPINNVTYMRHTFIAKAREYDINAKLDDEIIEAVWLDLETIESKKSELRSELVLRDIKKYLTGTHYPLDIIDS